MVCAQLTSGRIACNLCAGPVSWRRRRHSTSLRGRLGEPGSVQTHSVPCSDYFRWSHWWRCVSEERQEEEATALRKPSVGQGERGHSRESLHPKA